MTVGMVGHQASSTFKRNGFTFTLHQASNYILSSLVSVIMSYSSSFVFSFLYTGGKGVKKTIKKVVSGLVRDAERSWFAELSDTGNFPFRDTN